MKTLELSLRYASKRSKHSMVTVLTAAHCCQSQLPGRPDVVLEGIDTTIGVTQLPKHTNIRGAFQGYDGNRVHNEFVPAANLRIPSEYLKGPFAPHVEWDVCIIPLQQVVNPNLRLGHAWPGKMTLFTDW